MKPTMIQVSSSDIEMIKDRLEELEKKKNKLLNSNDIYPIDRKGKIRQIDYLIDLNKRMIRRV